VTRALPGRSCPPLLADRAPAGDIDIVVNVAYREVTLATNADDLADAVRTGRAVRVIVVGPLIARVRAAFRRGPLGPSLGMKSL
jgi:hypothetical protein